MRPFHIFPFFVSLIILFNGCSSHYYRTNDSGVTLYLRDPDSASVILYTSTDGFFPKTAKQKGSIWMNHVSTSKEFVYFYKVDGKLYTPDCRFKERDDFGFENCIYTPGL